MVRPSKKVFNQELKRLTILQAAKELFLEKKYSNIKMDEIAKHAGITKRTLYAYFPSKLALFIHVFDEYLQHLSQQLTAGANQDLPDKELILSLFDILYHFTKRNEKFMRLFWTLDSEEFDGLIPEELVHRIEIWTKAVHDQLKKVMNNAQLIGILNPKYKPELVIHLISAMNKAIFIHTSKENRFSIANINPDELYKVFVDLVHAGLFNVEVNCDLKAS